MKLIRFLRRRSPSGEQYFTTGQCDALVAATLALLGAMVSVMVLVQAGYVFFYQSFTPEVVYWACGQGFLHPGETPHPLLNFLFGRTHSFDCSTLPVTHSLGPPGLFARSQLYLSWSVALLWRLSNVDYRNLWPLVGALAGAYAAGCFALLRCFFERMVAAVGSLVLILSPVTLSMIVSLRDYSKGPFFIWGIVFLIAAIRASSRCGTLVAALSAGAIAGLGYGFRSDLMLMAPIGLLVLTFGPHHGTWHVRVWAPISFIVAGLIVAAPIFAPKDTAGGAGALIMQGATEPFRIFLGLGSAPYDLGWRYSDELTLSSIAADERANDPSWDANEGPAVYSASQAIRRSSAYAAQWLPLFAGDIATQTLKASSWVIGFPALVTRKRQPIDPGGVTRSALAPTRLISPFYDLLGHSWFPPVAILGILIFIWRVAAVRAREAICISLMFAILLAYPAIQFSVRHLFHLEFLWIMSALALVLFPFEWRKLAIASPRFALWVGFIAGVISVGYIGLLAFQDYSLRRELHQMIALPREPLALPLANSSSGDRIKFLMPVPESHRSLVEGPPDSMTDQLPSVANQWDTRAAVDRLVFTLGGPACVERSFRISFEYEKRENVWQPLDHEISIDLPQWKVDRSNTLVIAPAFYRPTQHLASIELQATQAKCIVAVERIAGRTKLPAVLSAALTPGWENRPLHRTFGTFSDPEVR